MSDEAETTVIYPVMTWRVAIGVEKACLVDIIFARNLEEAQKGVEGNAELPGVPLGMTANQCRELAADLVDAANKLDGQKGMM